jgi:hypothetical protein
LNKEEKQKITPISPPEIKKTWAHELINMKKVPKIPDGPMNVGRSELKAFFFPERAIFIGPSAICFGTLSTPPPMEAPFWTHPLQNRNKYAPLDYMLYTKELNFGQTKWDKTLVLLGASWGMHPGTWEPFGNILGTRGRNQKFPPSHPTPKRKKNRAHCYCMLSLPIGCMNFLFPKLFVTIFSLGEYPHYKLGVLINLKNHLDHFSQRFFEVKFCFI